MVTAYGKATKSVYVEPELEDNYYRAQIADVKDSTSRFDGEEHPQYMVKFDLLDEQKENGDPVNLFGFIRIPDGVIDNGELNEKSKLYEFLIALGYNDDDLEIEPTAWQGAQLRIQVKNKKVESGPNKGKNKLAITGYSPIKQQKAAAAAAQRRAPAATKAAAADDENDF